MMGVKSGRSVADITPPVGLYLTGFGGRAGPAQGIHDALHAKAMVISDGQAELAIVTIDLLGLDEDIVRAIGEGAGKLGIPAENVMLCSSHTHSGPATIALRGLGSRDEGYVRSIEGKIVGAIRQASANVHSSVLRVGEGRCEIGVNRRERTTRGGIVLGRNPLGPVDPTVTAITLESPAGRTVLYNYACHPVVLGPSNLLVSADYPGYAATAIEGAMRSSAAMFIQGCCGDINSKVVGGSFEDAGRLGGELGVEVLRAVERSEMEGALPLRSATREVGLALQELPSEEQIEREHAEYLHNLASARRSDDHGAMELWRGLLDWADATAQLVREGRRNLQEVIQLQVLRIGGIAIVAIPGEPFIEIALRIKARSGFKHTVVAGYSNGCMGYMPTPEAIEQGGYEVDSAHKYYDIAPLAPSAFDVIVETAAQLCAEVRAG